MIEHETLTAEPFVTPSQSRRDHLAETVSEFVFTTTTLFGAMSGAVLGAGVAAAPLGAAAAVPLGVLGAFVGAVVSAVASGIVCPDREPRLAPAPAVRAHPDGD